MIAELGQELADDLVSRHMAQDPQITGKFIRKPIGSTILTLNPKPLNPKPLNPKPLNPKPLNPKPLNPKYLITHKKL